MKIPTIAVILYSIRRESALIHFDVDEDLKTTCRYDYALHSSTGGPPNPPDPPESSAIEIRVSHTRIRAFTSALRITASSRSPQLLALTPAGPLVSLNTETYY